MKLITKDSRIKEAVEWANKYFESEDFEKDILSISKYDNSNVEPKKLVELFRIFSSLNRKVEVKCTYFGFWSRNVLGRTVGNGYAYVNSSNVHRHIWSLAATVVHESTHIVDEYFPDVYFGHGDNSPNGKARSFPYFIDEKAENWIKREVLKKEIERLSMTIVRLRGVAA